MTDTEQTTDAISLITAFNQKQKDRGNVAMEQAQRLVNQYRHISLLGDQFADSFNQTLLNATPEVLTSLNDIIGGPTVRRYYDYLKEKMAPASSETNDTNNQDGIRQIPTGGYLPSPDEDPVMSFSSTTDNTMNMPNTLSQEKMFKHIMDIHHSEIEKQNVFLKQTLDHLQAALKQQADAQQKATPPVKEVLEEQQRRQVALLNRLLERLLHAQTDILAQMLQKFNQNTQASATQQTQEFLQALKQNASTSQYSDIIEEAGTEHMASPDTSSTSASPLPATERKE